MPDDAAREKLLALIRDVNECANWMALEAWIAQKFRLADLHKLTYQRGREAFGLRSDATTAAIKKVAAAYKLNRYRCATVRRYGSVALHKRDFRILDGAVRIAVPDGHLVVPFVTRPDATIGKHGEARLCVTETGLALILVTETTVPDADASGALGVDLGVANIATDSEGNRYSGAALRGIRHRQRRLRTRLQSKQTRSAKRRLKRMRRKEARFGRDVNHCISKQLVATAERTKSAIVLEDLKGIRKRVRATRRSQRAELSSWSFYQLREFITYKAALAGVPVILVDPRNTSRECSECGHVDKRNRQNQAAFKCRACGHTAHADLNAALVIRSRALLSVPYATGLHGLVASPLGVN